MTKPERSPKHETRIPAPSGNFSFVILVSPFGFRHCNAIALLLPLAFLLASCASSAERDGRAAARQAMFENIHLEQPGDYFIGRRYYKKDYKFWGFVRKPGQPWSTAKLVIMDENQKLAPDRAINEIGSDNNYEYKLYGHFSTDPPVYEPASNNWYPSFILTGYELISVSPAPIFHAAAATDPQQRVVESPY